MMYDDGTIACFIMEYNDLCSSSEFVYSAAKMSQSMGSLILFQEAKKGAKACEFVASENFSYKDSKEFSKYLQYEDSSLMLVYNDCAIYFYLHRDTDAGDWELGFEEDDRYYCLVEFGLPEKLSNILSKVKNKCTGNDCIAYFDSIEDTLVLVLRGNDAYKVADTLKGKVFNEMPSNCGFYNTDVIYTEIAPLNKVVNDKTLSYFKDVYSKATMES